MDQPAVAIDDAFTISEVNVLNGVSNVFDANPTTPDSDPDSPLTVTQVNGSAGDVGNQITLPSGALLTLNANGTLSYDPNGQFEGTPAGSVAQDTFTYELNGNGLPATVTVTINGVDNNDVVVGTAGPDSLDGGQGDDTITGLADDDTLVGGPGTDSIDGGSNGAAGDTLAFANDGRAHTVDLEAGTSQSNVAVLDGSAGIASNAATLAAAEAGNAYFNIHTTSFAGGELRGQVSSIRSDTTVGLVRTVVFNVDELTGAAEVPPNASIATGAAELTIVDNNGVVTMFATVSIAGLSASDITAAHVHGPAAAGVNAGVLTGITPTVVAADATQTDMISNIENVTGSGQNDTLFGSGVTFQDATTGDMAVNTLDGGDGDDFLRGGAGSDMLIGGAGTGDTADYSTSYGAVRVNLVSGTGNWNHAEGDTLNGIENLIGSNVSDTLIGSGVTFQDATTGDMAVNTLDGGDGDDFLRGGAGSDMLIGGAGTGDTADYSTSYGAVRVNLVSGTGNWNHAEGDSLNGIENVRGSNFDDVLIGDGMANVLRGLAGDDVLTGNGGVDTFVFGNEGESTFTFPPGGQGADTITDFVSGTDEIDVRGLGANPGTVNVSDQGNDQLITFDGVAGLSILLEGIADPSGIDTTNDFIFV